MSAVEAPNRASPYEIFFRAVDRLQLESFLSSVKQEIKSLALLSQNQTLLDYYGEVVLLRLKDQFPDSSIEYFEPTDTELLLERFNALLNELSFDVAINAQKYSAPEKIWVIRNAKSWVTHNLELLIRLIQNFPGAGICALVMFQSELAESTKIFDGNQRFLKWVIELPTQEQKLSTIQSTKAKGHEEQTILFFENLEKTSKLTTKEFSDTDQRPQQQKNHLLPLTMVATGIIAIIVGTTSVVRPELGQHLLAFNQKNEAQNTLISKNTKSENAPDILEPEVLLTELPELATKGLNWLMNLEPEQYLVEYKTFTKMKDAQEYLSTIKWLKRAHIIPVYSDTEQEAHFIVVDGPFKTSEMAKKAAINSTAPNEILIEKVGSLLQFTSKKN